MTRHFRTSSNLSPIVFGAAVIAIVLALSIATGASLIAAQGAGKRLTSARETREVILGFDARADEANSEALKAYAEGRPFPNATVLEFFALMTEMEEFFAAESESPDSEIRRLARINLTNIADGRAAVSGLLDATLETDGEVAVLADVDTAWRFWDGLNARQQLSQDSIAAAGADRARSEGRALTWGLALIAVLAITIGLAALKVGRSRRTRLTRMTALAATDQLTGLANRRGIDQMLRERAKACPFTVVLLDLDGFKAVNDHYGHHAGDLVLEEAARRIDGSLRDGEFAGRFGGDEFLVGLPSVGEAAEERIAEFMGTLSRDNFPVVGPVGASAGYATCRDPGDVKEVVHRADSAMYQAKERSRTGRTTVAPLEPSDSVSDQNRLALERTAARIDELDPGSVGHSQRVARLAKRLALAEGWSERDSERLAQAAKVHDVGKVVLPEELLTKPRALSAHEYELVKQHPGVGARLAATALDPEQCSWIRHHHEWWCGRGYPDGLVERNIPTGARLLAIADAWDAMTSERVYADALDATEALAECRRARGTQLWPDGVDLLAAKLALNEADPTVTRSNPAGVGDPG